MDVSVQQPLLYIILTGILMILSVMMVITCLLVHHKKQLRRLNKEVKQSHVHHRQSTHHISLGGDKDDGYVIPTSVSHSTIGKKPQPKPIFHHKPPYMIKGRTYANTEQSESDHSYESLNHIMH
ncbi:uncharacterized protein LOC123510137 [Portunus trituberculatus]|uniref:uncharacterized protein LOC123510137 n=1 Tax=Portunus trituberculatus TaxID=210409 RepID=UPI001E1CF918|nr:uncharacterized protein LOC123510137 [Portunus trituberculatus]XP_045120913.1 uncharacterized protein LOC123510137 [Portunus trituberculatus]